MIGRLLDKYKILEEVGQGGMAVVYKGMDTSLHREVAVKVLHPHLASHEEARQRFEREAHAVAKLRHENILEIFDYSGKESADSYIVTEFIRGRTLKGIITEHAPAFPEIGAMIAIEVLRALKHAHSLGVLHRDIKPENIMVRDDGLVKLMDFGIAQIVDAARMTVTGQLLGSPAYMSPENIEGKPIDFRTDVFAVGILLYQLTTGELPFKGKNPHEILKKIADCRYQDPRLTNPLIADRLNKIITHALVREPDHRYPDVAPMLDDLLRFLAEVDLGDPRAELIKFFANPLSYEQALRQRLISALTRKGRAELEGKRAAVALDLFNRVLTIDPRHEEVLALIEKLHHRRRLVHAAVLALGVCALAAAAYGAESWREARKPLLTADPWGPSRPSATALPVLASDAGVAAMAASPEPALAHPPLQPHKEPAAPRKEKEKPEPSKSQPAVPAITGIRNFTMTVFPGGAMYSVDDRPAKPIMGIEPIPLEPGSHTIAVHHVYCKDQIIKIRDDEPEQRLPVRLEFKPAQLKVVCPRAKWIFVDSKPMTNNDTIDFKMEAGKRKVDVLFKVEDKDIPRSVEVTAGAEATEVRCE